MSHRPTWFVVATLAAMCVSSALVVWHYWVLEWFLDRWLLWRLRVARRVRRAAYIRWWRSRGNPE